MRQRRRRERLKTAPLGYNVRDQATSPRDVTPDAPIPPQATLHETAPVTGPGADAFAAPPFVPSSKEGETGAPFVPPTPEPQAAPRPPATAKDVAVIATAVAWYFELGSMAMFMRHPQLFELVPGGRDSVGTHFPTVKAFVRESAESLAMKWNIAFKYQDELVVAGALGLATFGLFGDTGKNDNTVTRDPPPRHARDANPPTERPQSRAVRPDEDTEPAAPRQQRDAREQVTEQDDVTIGRPERRSRASGDGDVEL